MAGYGYTHPLIPSAEGGPQNSGGEQRISSQSKGIRTFFYARFYSFNNANKQRRNAGSSNA